MVTPQRTTFKLFWSLVAVFASLNAFLVVAANDKPYEPEFWVGGLPGPEVFQNQIYNISWGGSMKPSNITVMIAQMPDTGLKGNYTLHPYPLVENTTDNPYAWNMTLPVGTIWQVMVSPNGGHGSGVGTSNVHVLKASAASKLLVTGASTLGFMLLAFVAMMQL